MITLCTNGCRIALIENYNYCAPPMSSVQSACIVSGNQKALSGDSARYFNDSTYRMLQYTSNLDWGTDTVQFTHDFDPPKNFKVLLAVFFADTIEFDTMETIALGVKGASIYAFNSTQDEFRVFNFYRDSTSESFKQITKLSYPVNSIWTKPWYLMVDEILPLHGVYVNSMIIVTNPALMEAEMEGRVTDPEQDDMNENYMEALEEYAAARHAE